MTKDEALKLALEDICAAKLCEINFMSSRQEQIRLMDKAITTIKEALAQQEQEPHCYMDEYGYVEGEMKRYMEEQGGWFPVYTAPPKRKPLTDEEIAKAWAQSKGDILMRLKPFARAIEAAHGIKGE